MNRRPQTALIPLALAALAAGAYMALAVKPVWYGAASAALSLAALGVGLIYLASYQKAVQRDADDIFKQNASASAQIMNTIAIPAILFDEGGRIIWSNAAFRDIYSGKDIRRLLPSIDTSSPAAATAADVGGSSYQVMCVPVERDNPRARRLTFQYWIDRTEVMHYSRLYEENMPTVALVYVDNYEELNADRQFHRNSVLAEVEKLVSELTLSVGGAYRRYDNARFFIVFEAEKLKALEESRFSLLEKTHSIETGTEQPVTLSIAVGAENRIASSDDSARQSMELALGRGGDQAIVKRGANYSFYGGGRQLNASRQSRVKTRLFSRAFRQLIESSDQVFIMGHSSPDMDCLGAALGIMRCAALLGKKSYFVLDQSNNTIDGALEAMASGKEHRDAVRTPEQALSMMRTTSVVVVVDTQRESSVIAPAVYERAARTVIIDHHRRNVDILPNPTLNYLEASASSACEMVTEVIEYFAENFKPTAFESSALLAGMTMDTKSFTINTGARTFEAAAFLRKCGADTSLIKLMYQDDMQTFRNRAKVVENAFILDKGVAISSCHQDMPNNSLIAAQSADALLGIKGIQAAFVLADKGGSVTISGRSIGTVNVQIILERMGGGGHLTIAGATIHNKPLDEVLSELTDIIKSYIKEAGIQ